MHPSRFPNASRAGTRIFSARSMVAIPGGGKPKCEPGRIERASAVARAMVRRCHGQLRDCVRARCCQGLLSHLLPVPSPRLALTARRIPSADVAMALVEWVGAFREVCRRILKIFATVDLHAVRVSIGWASTRGSVTPPHSAMSSTSCSAMSSTLSFKYALNLLTLRFKYALNSGVKHDHEVTRTCESCSRLSFERTASSFFTSTPRRLMVHAVA